MEQSEELEIQVKYIRINAILSISKWKKKKKFPTGRVYWKQQTRVTTNQYIFKSGLIL